MCVIIMTMIFCCFVEIYLQIQRFAYIFPFRYVDSGLTFLELSWSVAARRFLPSTRQFSLTTVS